ncbi:glycogen/starch/alpha-glucan phosphorylase [Shewanella sp. GD03713]|uniref:glycogen/starch/alpha-glucan phosphorylase n=1 Tax=Shewanella sp. GD03713 TaxID=2975372 RepID=UPI000B34302B|nr:glycogen/starch/alpha-glucan phosphorylase [Shewanella sp. GD03713]MDH1471216.1 glycogen/starch/alpha-glucan phosphorylase [Shewanella sp. GD03713]QXN26154.1 glycogen/starch/alpha-glucan phosphorylase [Shewanella putrefaciens]VEE60833.1 Maltodextrin phosphorylase [Shewanella putrefaciens]
MSHNSELSPNTSGVPPKKRATKAAPTKPKATLEPCEPCDALPATFNRHVRYGLSRGEVAHGELFQSLALSVKEQMLDEWRETRIKDSCYDNKQVAYLSLEFLMGRALGNALLNLDLEQDSREALSQYSVSLEELEEAEHDAGLGNGGLGRLAACFLDSCASMDLSVTGYGIRYEYGMFAQKIVDGYQVERPDRWLREGNPWEVRVPHHNVTVKFFGHTESYVDKQGRRHMIWVDSQDVLAVAYDMPVPGYRNGRVNSLRLWKAEATDDFDLAEFNQGDYTEAVACKNLAEQITMVLYPNDASENGKELRLRQQYFLSSASLQAILKRWVHHHGHDFSDFAAKNVIQLNDTHPSIAVPELMRLLVDEYGLEWDAAWAITSKTMAYTNHTLLPEALERWPVRMMALMLPRILEIIYEINARYLDLVAHHWPGDGAKLASMSIIQDGPDPHVRMAYLAIVASFSVNGVAALHTQLLKSGLFKDFYSLWPEKFNNRTNGVTPRRWLAHCNPALAKLLTSHLGKGWVTDLSQLTALNALTQDTSFIQKWREVKQANKVQLAKMIAKECGVEFDPAMLFDVQVKRIHEYKRQLLNILHVIHLYHQIQQGHTEHLVPRCVLIGGKAAPGYFMAKLIIKLASNVAHMVNCDPVVAPYLRFAFLPNYNVSAMEKICPGTDVSEQISTAGKEASGTGNMKFMMNGALTIGTLDGANIEMLEEVGEDNFFLFGLNAEQVVQMRCDYQPQRIIAESHALSEVMALLKSGHFNLLEPGIFDPIIASIESPDDQWMTAADFDSYRLAQEAVAKAYKDPKKWTQMSIRNTAASGRFSSDVTIAGYRDDIWKL